MLRLTTFGGLALEATNGATAPRLTSQRLALLAVLVSAGERGVSRERVVSLFWPDADDERARHSLRQALYALRHEVGIEIPPASAALSVSAAVLSSDIAEFHDALARGERERAVALVRGPFLDGFHLQGASGFQRWQEEERSRLLASHCSALLFLANDATRAGRHDAASEWWRALTLIDPLSGRFAAGYLAALAACGERAQALTFVRAHRDLVRRELDADVDPNVRMIEVELRSGAEEKLGNGSTPKLSAWQPVVSDVVSTPATPTPHVASLKPGESAPDFARGQTRVPARSVVAFAGLAAVAFVAVQVIRDRVTFMPRMTTEQVRPPVQSTASARAEGSITGVTTSSPVALRLYEEGLRAFYAGDGTAAYRLMASAGREDSSFAMAAYHEAQLAPGELQNAAFERALRLAARAPTHERLFITAEISSRLGAPSSMSVAETLSMRFPGDPRAQATLARALDVAGEWARARDAIERAIALDSAVDAPGRGICFVCDDYWLLADTYFWWDSLDAADRTAQRFLQVRPNSDQAWLFRTTIAARRGDSVAALANFHRYATSSPTPVDPTAEVRRDLLLERYDLVERNLRPLLESPRASQYDDGHWLLLIALRNEGRLREAAQFLRTGVLDEVSMPVSRVPNDDVNNGLVAFESGDFARATVVYTARHKNVSAQVFPGLLARGRAWTGTLLGMVVGGAGDTTRLRMLADTVQYWGARSAFGRDQLAHHYLRGLLATARNRQDEALREYRAAMFSPSLGFTRVNYELARTLLQKGDAREAVAVLQPALRGEIEASNLYVTRSELHELLAQSFARALIGDSAAVHYRAVVKAWQRADPAFQPRVARAQDWLNQYARRAHVASVP